MWPDSILRLIGIAAVARGLSPGTIGRAASGSGDFHGRLLAGRDITSRRAARIVQWLSDNWPPGANWPPDIPRPTPRPADAPTRKGAA